MAHISDFILEMGIFLIISTASVSQQRISQKHTGQKILLLLQELCYLPDLINVEDIKEKIIKEFSNEIEIVVINESVMCDTGFVILSILQKEIEDRSTIAIIGSVEPFLCEFISKLADGNKKLFISWNCPKIIEEESNPNSYTVRMLPPVRDVVGAIFSLFKHFRWKHSTIVTVENNAWWTRMGSEFEFALSNENVSLSSNAFIILPTTSTELFIKRQFYQMMAVFKLKATMKGNLDEVVILCVPEYSYVFWKILRVLADSQICVPVLVLRLSSNFYVHQYFASQQNLLGQYYERLSTTFVRDVDTNAAAFDEESRSNFFCNNTKTYHDRKTDDNLEIRVHNWTDNELHKNKSNHQEGHERKYNRPPGNEGEEISSRRRGNATGLNVVYDTLKHQLLIVSPYFEEQTENPLLLFIKTSTKIISNRKLFENSMDDLTRNDLTDGRLSLSDLTNTSSRAILRLRKRSPRNCSSGNLDVFDVLPLISNSHNWFNLKMQMKYNVNQDNGTVLRCYDCEDDYFARIFDDFSLDLILLILFIFVVVGVFVSCLLMVARKQYMTRRRMKDPCKILLTSEDIVFPQISEPSRVEEGIEAMLCCWLQELHEFGGPEVDKPDLLKGPDDSVKSFPLKHVNSSNSIAKPIASTEIRARYNGDLVQLKDIPAHSGSFELRSKSLNVLMMIHGLRHENLNPLIGLMVDTIRPALVWEYCSRGSLEDVLIQDEIKLDWSFRLSLLTDLVRGMKYLHSCPYRVHGSLSSRNCVIDARWVLKITDYCLTEFNEAQNITSEHKNARDLLWTAPELLRDENLMRRGTQPGDVYSFAIIMQEVVVRGEPFCMLSLTPEDIIEKLKTPPPLIRPSVSKGAAPPEAINIMRQCWAEQPEKRPDFNQIYDLFKTLNHGRKINFVDTMFQMLEKYSNNLEDLIRERTEQLDVEKKKTEQLLMRMLPYSVAEKLKLGMPVDPEEFSEVTIYFSDIVGFTTISAYSTPFEVVDLLNDLYTCFDATINAYNVYKVETIGDAYMVVGGLPVRIPNHADQIATMALDLLHQSGQFKIRHLPLTPLRLRIGLHTGPCCAGVVGLTMPRYCLFGDTVNTASRLESTGSPGRIHISEATKLKLDLVGKYKLEYRGETELKGKGKMPTYWLLGKEGFDKEIPVPPPITLDEDLIRASSDRSGRQHSFTKLPSESSIEFDPSTSNSSKHLIVQKSLDSGLFVDATSSHSHKTWTARRQMTFDLSDRNEYHRNAGSFDQKMKNIPETNGKVVESGRSSPFSMSDKNIDLVGVPFINSKTIMGHAKTRKYNATGGTENDLSTPYNYYRCLPPSENPSSTKFVSKFLKRQFSVDKSDDSAIVLQEMPISKTTRLFKQNSTGTNHDTEKTEKSHCYKFNNNSIIHSMSASTESLT